jgi:ketosteroid isomerase-like protein
MVSPKPLLKAIRPLACAALLLPGVAWAGGFEEMVAAEKAFASDASNRNTRDAFLSAYDQEGVAFNPGPTSAQRLWDKRAPNKSKLQWVPEVAEVASSEDLGYTVGPWAFTPEGADKPAAYGHFFTIWHKAADGSWKVLVDNGISHGKVAFPATVTRRGGISAGTKPTWQVGLAELRVADQAPPGALNARMVSSDFLRLREGQMPDAKAEGEALPSHATRIDTGMVVSKAGDLAATWGGGVGSPSWVRVWRRPAADDAPGRNWVLVAEIVVPAAPEPEKK